MTLNNADNRKPDNGDLPAFNFVSEANWTENRQHTTTITVALEDFLPGMVTDSRRPLHACPC